MGERVAHSLSIRGVLEYLDLAPGFGIVKVRPPEPWVGRSLRRAGPRSAPDQPVALRRGKELTVNPPRDACWTVDDEVILLGRDEQLERIGR